MKIIKLIVRKILNVIDSIIDFINYIANTNLSNLPKFSEMKINKE